MARDLERIESLLERTPLALRGLLQGLPPELLATPERAGAWSARDVALHMADLERDGWLPRIRLILEQGVETPLPTIERERFREHYADWTLVAALDDFQRTRMENLTAFRALALTPAHLATRGRHHLLGEVTLSELISTWAVHDLTHLAQITRTLAAPFREEVGPWREYLSILRP